MTRPTLLISAAVSACALALTACTESGDDTATAPPTSASSGSTDDTAQSDASAESDGEHSSADVMFAQMMIPHHEQAIEMSDIILGKDDVPADVTTLAGRIKAEQGPEIAQMNSWLEQWGRPADGQNGHSGHGDMADSDMADSDMAEGGDDMPMMDGMLSSDELRQLSEAQGTDAARLFLEQMIAHHEGAIDMAEVEVAQGTYQPAIDMATSIIETQQREIDTMRGMLSAM